MQNNAPPLPYEANASRFSGRYLFKNNVNRVLPSAKTTVQARFLPSFDWDLSTLDKSFSVGWAPYRQSGTRNAQTGQPELSRWYVCLEVFDKLGSNGYDTILSNRSRKVLCGGAGYANDSPDVWDAFADVYIAVKRAAKNDTSLKWLTENPDLKTKTRPPVPRPETKVMFNVTEWQVKMNRWQNGVMSQAFGSLEHITNLLNQYPNPSDGPQRDPLWPYMLGDVTHPDTGLLFYTCQRTSPGKSLPTNTVQFSADESSARGVTVVPVTQEVLANRTNLWDPLVYNWMTYQEEVDYMVQNTCIPHNYIAEACGNRASLPFPSGGSPVAPSTITAPPGGLPGMSQPAGMANTMAAGMPQPVVFPAPGSMQHVGAPSPVTMPGGPLYPASNILAGNTAPPPVSGAVFSPPAGYSPPAQMGQPAPAHQLAQAPPASLLAQEQDWIPGTLGDPNYTPPAQHAVAPPSPVVTLAPAQLPSASFPPAGWEIHPSNSDYYYQGSTVVTEVELRQIMAQQAAARPAPVPPAAPVAPMAPPVPQSPMAPSSPVLQGAPGAAFQPPSPAGPPQFLSPPPSVTVDSGWSPDLVKNVLGEADAARYLELDTVIKTNSREIGSEEVTWWVDQTQRIQTVSTTL